MAVKQYKHLSHEQVEHFMTYGWVKIPECFTKEAAEQWTKDVWKRLGYNKDDPSTWLVEKINMPIQGQMDASKFAPKAWAAICELCGGEDRVYPDSINWRDAFIVNFGTEELRGKIVPPRDLDNWHVDGDFFTHFLDSPEQGLLVIPCLSDVVENGGATYICPDGIGVVARHLHDHPEGVTPHMECRGKKETDTGLGWFNDQIRDETKCNLFQQMTGNVGDVVLMHPLMMHSASKNALRTIRIIINPPVSLKEPFNFNRSNPDQYSLVELKTLKELGVKGLPNWKIQGQRALLNPRREEVQARLRELENRRLAGEDVPPVGDLRLQAT